MRTEIAPDESIAIPPFLRRTNEEPDMARKKKSNGEAPAETPASELPDYVPDDPGPDTEAAAADNGIGHNHPPAEASGDLTDDQKQALALQWKRKFEAATARKDEAVAELRNIRKKIKAELGDDGVDLVKDMIALESEDGEAELQARMERAIRAAKYMAASLGAQFELFEDRTPAADRAAAEGKRDGMAGKTLSPTYAPGTPQYDAYVNAWHDGQKAIFAIQKKQDGALFDQADAGDVPPIGDAPATFTEETATAH